jgi:hypothetical protein
VNECEKKDLAKGKKRGQRGENVTNMCGNSLREREVSAEGGDSAAGVRYLP